MKRLRKAVVAASAAVAALVPARPASALNVAEFDGSATIGCFGCGTYGPAGNSASFFVTGTVNGVTAVNAAGAATYTVTNPIGVTCVVNGTAIGSLTVNGVGSTTFNWTRTGAVAVVTTGWGTGLAAFAVVSPLRDPCGGTVTANFAGVLLGA